MSLEQKMSLPLVTIGGIAQHFNPSNRPIYRRSNNDFHGMLSAKHHVRVTVTRDGDIEADPEAAVERFDPEEKVVRLA